MTRTRTHTFCEINLRNYKYVYLNMIICVTYNEKSTVLLVDER